MFYKRPSQESHPKVYVTGQKDEDLWEDPLDAGARHNRPLGLRRGMMMMMMMMMMIYSFL
jgi:hypothetical protein